MKLIPASRAFAMIREDVASSVGPPNIIVPRHIGEIFRPLRPSLRYCMCLPLPPYLLPVREKVVRMQSAPDEGSPSAETDSSPGFISLRSISPPLPQGERVLHSFF